MAKVIGLSGPQGGGKSTLLDGLVSKQNGIEVDNFKVSRRVQRLLGWITLDHAFESPESMIEFQTMIMNVKHLRDQENAERTDVDIVLTERTFADISSYTTLWAWKLVRDGKWKMTESLDFALKFADECSQYQQVYDGNIFLPYMSHVKFESDPHRADEKDVDFITNEIETFFKLKSPQGVPVFRITETSIQGRIDQAHKWIQTL